MTARIPRVVLAACYGKPAAVGPVCTDAALAALAALVAATPGYEVTGTAVLTSKAAFADFASFMGGTS